MTPTISGDRLYGITLRPQELALYGGQVAFHLRYAPMCDESPVPTTTHAKILVLEVVARLDPADELARQGESTLLVAKCGWELELTTPEPVPTPDLPELAQEVPLLLERIADTINELGQRAGIGRPIGPEVVTHLLHRYRTEGVG